MGKGGDTEYRIVHGMFEANKQSGRIVDKQMTKAANDAGQIAGFDAEALQALQLLKEKGIV